METLHINKPFTFPNGSTIRNRLVKSAMAEGYMEPDCLPGDGLITNYSRWAQGGWGMLITGNYMIDPKGMSFPGMLLVNNDTVSREVQVAKLKAFASAARANGTKIIAQLCHPGRAGILIPGRGGKNIAPSPIRISFGDGFIARALAALMTGTPREMTREDIDNIVGKFASAARLMAEAGFDGVELHGAHGYLISQFLSAESNQRTDEYGGSALDRTKFAVQVIEAVKAAVPDGFIVGIKLNSVDYQTDRSAQATKEGHVMNTEKQLQECVDQFGAIAAAGVDYVNVSGGTMENPRMANGPPKSTRTKAREAFFLSFAESFRASFPDVPLMVTGGFHSRTGMEEAVAGGGTDLVGIGRGACACPSLPSDVVLNPEVADSEARVVLKKYPVPWWLSWGPQMVGVGWENNFYSAMIRALGTEQEGKKN
ncbi:NADH:flavin oxidoreductase/NADH oxidase [Microdochium trichocladiopsis]|uniref:NADH:flavin oxidoreductase/NADH oxidase n=1 Tax=Microdochium trichocladiopsis TaxID=1682393 RepID=A0A9P9BLJ7_9PEZI|nr:NADH:flavin oxidoreductase/NADH oxidase [Microdochium trichocladiopsis]KAH7014162.1 NADH:flavin oxidoreductase/NADH oxidase [Microdochium trichocladiopsis]